MRLLIDLQGAQSESRFRGIGRYSLSLVRALTEYATQQDRIEILLNQRLCDSITSIRSDLSERLIAGGSHPLEVAGPVKEIDGANAARARVNEVVREAAIAAIAPDIALVTSLFEGYVDDAVTSVGRYPRAVPTAVVLYDLIPLLRADEYLARPDVRAWYERKIHSLKQAAVLLSISRHTRDEAIDVLKIPAERIVDIGVGLDPDFKQGNVSPETRARLLDRYQIDRPYVMYTGGFDPRKNLDRLIQAFAAQSPEVRAQYQLAIVGRAPELDVQRLKQLTRRSGLKDESVVYTGYTPDTDLALLYSSAALFVFPSLHEGFGLPALEAMACGAPTIGANASSIPEVIGLPDALFDPHRVESIAEKLAQGLNDRHFRHALIENGRVRATQFTWQSTAARTLGALRELKNSGRSFSFDRQRRPRLAIVVATIPPTAGGAPYVESLAKFLQAHYEVELIKLDDDYHLQSKFGRIPVRSKLWFEDSEQRFDRVMYVIDDLTAMKDGDELACSRQGLALLHGRSLARESTCPTGGAWKDDACSKAVYLSHGLAGVMAMAQSEDETSLWSMPADSPVLEHAAKVLVEHQDQIEAAVRWYGEPIRNRLVLINSLQGLHHARSFEPNHAGSIGKEISEAIETTYASSDWNVVSLLRHSLVQAEAFRGLDRKDQIAVAHAAALSIPARRRPRLYVDVTTISERDSRTGIQRCVRALVLEWLRKQPEGYRVEPVRLDMAGRTYRCAVAFGSRLAGVTDIVDSDEPLEVWPGDVFIGLDLVADRVPYMEDWFSAQRDRGLAVHFVVYDLLPVRLPEYFPESLSSVFKLWLNSIARVSDSLLCISNTVREEVLAWLNEEMPQREGPLKVSSFPLGADMEVTAPTRGLPAEHSAIMQCFQRRATFLMVGTIEPRKGHAQALQGFQRLWSKGIDVGLLLLGKPGWMMDEFIATIGAHQEFGSRLFWVRESSDEMLEHAYRGSAALIAASFGEGFGLPLIEAVRHGLPLIARDIPVFREVAGDSALYYVGSYDTAISDAVELWLQLQTKDTVIKPSAIAWVTWAESAERLSAIMAGNEATIEWRSDSRIPPGHSLSFDSHRVKWHGWSVPETAHRWSNGVRAVVDFSLRADTVWQGQLSIDLQTFGRQRIGVRLNGRPLGEWTKDTRGSSWDVMLPVDVLRFDYDNRIEFLLPDARMPSDQDRRQVAIAVRSLEFT